eukprot:573195-Rhodomonas_salina.1
MEWSGVTGCTGTWSRDNATSAAACTLSGARRARYRPRHTKRARQGGRGGEGFGTARPSLSLSSLSPFW